MSPWTRTRAANLVEFFIEFKFEFEFSLFCEFEFGIYIFASSSPVKIYQVFSSSERSYYLEHVQMKINSSFLQIFLSSNSSSQLRIFTNLSLSSSFQLRRFLSSSSAKNRVFSSSISSAQP